MTFTNEQLRDTMRAVVREHGKDHKVPAEQMCSYGTFQDTRTIVPVCIVGHVLFRLDPTFFEEVVRVHNHTKIGVLADKNPGMFTDEQRAALGMAQVIQDRMGDWGYCLEVFEEELGA